MFEWLRINLGRRALLPVTPTFIGLILAGLLSDFLNRWMVLAIARGLSYFVVILFLYPFVRKSGIGFSRLFIYALFAGGATLTAALIFGR